MTVSEFEARIPANAKLKRMRIENGKVSFAMGYDTDETLAIMWNSKGKAYIRPITTKSSAWKLFSSSHHTRCFNGRLHFRANKYDLIYGNSKSNLIYRLRKKGFVIDTKLNTIFVDNIHDINRIQIKRLRDKFHYKVQLIF